MLVRIRDFIGLQRVLFSARSYLRLDGRLHWLGGKLNFFGGLFLHLLVLILLHHLQVDVLVQLVSVVFLAHHWRQIGILQTELFILMHVLVSLTPFVLIIQTLRFIKVLDVIGVCMQGPLQIVLDLRARVRVSVCGRRLNPGIVGALRHRVKVLLSKQWIRIELALHFLTLHQRWPALPEEGLGGRLSRAAIGHH